MRTVRASIREFWSLVEEGSPPQPGQSPCWNWIGSNAYSGYKGFRTVLAHRAAATIYCGKIPTHVRQACGNKACMRLSHLIIYTEVANPSNVDEEVRDNEKMEMVDKVLDARGHTRYKVDDIHTITGIRKKEIKKILREAPLYDLLREVLLLREHGKEPQSEPNVKRVVSHAS